MDTKPALDDDVRKALAGPLFGYAKPLKVAWTWNRSGKPADSGELLSDLEKAEQLLAELAKDYDEQPVRFEQAFNFVRQKKRPQALAILRAAELTFRHTLGEDTLSLMGRLHKDEGDDALAQDDLGNAENAYRKAQELYDRAAALNRDRFPAINAATLAFLRAGLVKGMADRLLAEQADDGQIVLAMNGTADELKRNARLRAAELLRTRKDWVPRLPDDPIWIHATAAEAAVLSESWSAAATDYAAALGPDNEPKPFHFDSIYGQIRRLLEGYKRLGERFGGPLADPAAFFNDLARKANVTWSAPTPPETAK